MAGRNNYIACILKILVACFSSTAQEELKVETMSIADPATQLAQFLVQPDPLDIQYFLVIKKETHKYRGCLFFDGPNTLSASMIHRGSHQLEIPLQFGDYRIFDRLTYAFKHQTTKIVFIFFPSLHPDHCDELDLSYPYDLKLYGMRADRRQDILMYVVNASMPWHGYLEIHGRERFTVPSNVFLASFDNSDADDRCSHVRIGLYSLHRDPCVKTILCTETAVPLSYSALLTLAESHRNLEHKEVHVLGMGYYEFATGDKGLDPFIAQILRGRQSLRFSHGNTDFATAKLLVDLSDRTNFTVLIKKPNSGGCHGYQCEWGYMRRSIIQDEWIENSLPASYLYPAIPLRILYGHPAQSNNSVAQLVSMSTPFDWKLWLVLLAVVIFITMCGTLVARKSRGAAALSWTAPFLNQAARPAVPKRLIVWYSLWALMATLLNGFYMAKLRSSEITPPVVKENGLSFRNLANKQFTFHADKDTVRTMGEEFYDEHDKSFSGFTGNLPIEVRNDHFLLTKLLVIQEPGVLTDEEAISSFLQLKEAALIDTETVIRYVQNMLKTVRHETYHVLNEKFMEAPVFLNIDNLQDTSMSSCYERMSESGIVEFWDGAKLMSKERLWLRLLSKMSDLKANRTEIANFGDTASKWVLRDLYLVYGIGIGSAAVILVSTQLVRALRVCAQFILVRLRNYVVCQLFVWLWCSCSEDPIKAGDGVQAKVTRVNIYKSSIEE